jgi:hypothetical protein
VPGTDSQLKLFSPTMLWAPPMSFPYLLTDVAPTPLPLCTIRVVHNLARKAGGVSMAFRLAKIGILVSSKMAWVGARHWGHRMVARCDVSVLAHTRSIIM